MAILSGLSPASPELPQPGNDPIAQAIAEFEARGAEEDRRYIPGELSRQYRQLGAHEGYARLQQTVASAWHEDNANYVSPIAGASIYPTMRERAGLRHESALRAKMTLDFILAAGQQAMAHYRDTDGANRAAAWAIGSQIYDQLHGIQPRQTSSK